MKKRPSALLVSALLGALTVVLYWPITGQGFVELDDPTYLLRNSHVQSGLTWSGMVWALDSGYASNWHPLTWMSHMLDFQLYGLDSGGHHLTNLILHAFNSMLLFAVFRRLTGAFWRSALVAALFAWHPLHVESVAWAAERKDVLSTLFFLLTLWAYVRYTGLPTVEKNVTQAGSPTTPPQSGAHEGKLLGSVSSKFSGSRRLWYSLSLVLFSLGLMSKPMVVTLPCVLLLLDFWPLKRIEPAAFRLSTLKHQLFGCRWLLVEKLPFFALSLGACVVTYAVQNSGGAVTSLAMNPFGSRVANAVVAYPRYLLKTIWPVELSVFYPLPDHWPVLAVVGGAALLLGLSVLAVRWSGRRPYVFIGWFWFVGTLVPAIGLVQVGSQSMADRYMYIPSIGLFLILAWSFSELGAVWQNRVERSSPHDQPTRPLVATSRRLALWVYCSPAAALVLCTALTAQQIAYWRSEETLFRHAMQVCPDNYLAYDHLAKVCEGAGRKTEAESYYLALLKLKPLYPQGQYNLGTLEMELGKLSEATRHLSAAVALQPDFADAHCNLGLTLFRQNRLPDAADQLAMASQLAPQNVDVHVNLGVTFLAMSAPARAADSFARALALKADSPGTHFLLALALSRAQKPHEAIAQAEQARELALSTGQPDIAAKANDLLKQCRPE